MRYSVHYLCTFQDLFLFQESSFEENEDTPKRDIASMPNVNSDDLGAKYLVFVSSRSVKMREFCFFSLYTF